MRIWRDWAGPMIGLLVLTLSVRPASADEPVDTIQIPARPRCVDGTPKHFEESCAYLDRRDAVAAADAHAPRDALYGIYTFNTGTIGAELALDRDGWAGFRESSDAGVPFSGIVGRYRVSDDTLLVQLEPELGGHTAPTRLEYRIVRWGTHVFLLEPEQLTHIVATLNRDGLEQAALWLDWDMQRLRNRKDPLCGSPRLMGEWRRYLHARPLHVSLIDAKPDPTPQFGSLHAREYLIEIDSGRAQGLFPHMFLEGEATDSQHLHINATIERVDEHRAWGKLTVYPKLTTDSTDAFAVGKGTRLVSGEGWNPAACVPMR